MARLILASDGDSALASWSGAELSPVPAPQSLTQIFMELREPVCRYLLAMGMAASEAEEVVQETFLRLCQHMASDGKQANLRGWVFRVAHNLARDEHRRRQRRPSEPLGDEKTNGRAYRDSLATPEQQVIAQQRTLRLKVALERLPARQRECLHLRAEGLRYREIAEVVGAGVSTVAEWVQQGLKTLGKECDENPGK